jgi:hypothetical protein
VLEAKVVRCHPSMKKGPKHEEVVRVRAERQSNGCHFENLAFLDGARRPPASFVFSATSAPTKSEA